MAEPVIQRVRIYLNGEDWAGNQPLYKAILAELRQSGATGATALPALAGFGPRRQMLPNAERQPVVIEWIDHVARIKRLLPIISAMADSALITVEAVEVAQGLLRPGGPFGAEQLVSDIMQSEAPAIAADAPLADALTHLVAPNVDLLPVLVDETVIGIISARELAWRAGLRLPPEVIGVLTPAELAAVSNLLRGRSAGDIANREVRGVAPTTPIPQALTMMIEWGYGSVPVIDGQGRLTGILGQQEVLQAVARQPEPDNITDTGVQVRMIMQAAVSRIALDQSLASALALLITAPGHLLFVVDGEEKLVGMLRLATIVSQLQGNERNVLLAALQRAQPTPATALPGARRSIDTLLEPPPPPVSLDASLIMATRQLLNLNAERLPVVDSDGRLSGIIARSALIRALLQQSS
ncbi:DUF190 domain-containing protein [Chloroflexus sp.]|uniref:DUF190 domain-containing protein n=1 Tax=Chloroflexus sp. TaxID=1904827 RepID=UPI00262EF0EE|nr:DUF190 domain-containing protein [uncultured Chloroflexus sp.]